MENDIVGSDVKKFQRKIWFDVSDLLGYFPDNRTPTGIQRVQISIIQSLLSGSEGEKIALCQFLEDENGWFLVDPDRFVKVSTLSLMGSDARDLVWRREVSMLRQEAMAERIDAFPLRSVLINIGTSWWLPNYFMHIREAKKKSDIYYIPFIHDVIPAVAPRFCAHALVHEFIDWFMGVVQHSDRYFAVSEASKKDFLALATELNAGIPSADVRVVHLAAEKKTVSVPTAAATSLFRREGIEPGKFVFFVSTVESRKNQAGALDAWQNLIRNNPKLPIPKLVIVGKRGFESHFFLEKLATFIEAEKHIVYIESVSDDELAALYSSCLFTIYPSYYEGWGLPITESLGYGKVCVTADNSSLPEAGQGLTVTYRTGSNHDFEEKLLSLIKDRGHLSALEQRIAENFQSRHWETIAQEVLAFAHAVQEGAQQTKKIAPVLEAAYYPLNRNRQLKISSDLTSAEVLRDGSGWHRLEDFGSWTRGTGARLTFTVAQPCNRIAIQLKGIPSSHCEVTVSANLAGSSTKLRLNPDEEAWCFLDFDGDIAGKNLNIDVYSREVETTTNPETGHSRVISAGVCGVYLFDKTNANARTDFIEAKLFDLLKYKKVKKLLCTQ
ncbi:glycosyltransferase family 4 protein [Gluconacetobacter sp. 1b LMG 1731]|uniref:Glycosyltransferase family 4 protein n=1 Tax=Gluconacetobacter dulcium TaxID=2729096 RepID=A0A7W4IIL1_9PROT|nr:glycosyltransferase family 4 protein [Gluconacetobacter dulcium]MBB2193021.1 glycosyltransferase family 4 protein [Gluconacetobacter dulcium]